MDWNSTPMAWLLLLGFLSVLVSSRHYPRESRNLIHPLSPLWVLLSTTQSSSEDNVKEPHSLVAVGRERSILPQAMSRVRRPAAGRVLSSMSSESGQVSPTAPLAWPSSSKHLASFTSPGPSSSAASGLAPSGPVAFAVTKATIKPETTSVAIASVSGPVEQMLISESPTVISSPSSLDPRQSVDGLMSNETPRTERHENPSPFPHGLYSYRARAKMSIAQREPTTSESNTSGLTRQPEGISPAHTIVAASSAETKGPTPTQASISVSPLMEGPGMVGHPPALSSGAAEANTSLYLTPAPSDLGNTISTAILESNASTPASITLVSAELSSPEVPELPALVTLYPKESEAPTPEPSGQAESEPPPAGGALLPLIQDTNPLSDVTVSSVGSDSRGPSTLSSLPTLPLPSPALYSPSPPPPSPPPPPSSSSSSSSSLLRSPPMLILNTIQSTTSGILKDPSVPTSTSASIESSTNTSSLQFFHQTTHQEGLELTTSEPTRFPSSGSAATASLAPGTNTSGLAVISNETSVMDSSPTSTVSLENFSSISSVSSSSTTLSVHLTATPTITPYLSWSHPSITESMDSAWSLTSVETELSMPSASSPAQYPLLLDSVSSSPGYNHVTRSLTFKITNEIFTVALYDPTSLVYRLLSENVQNQLTPIYRRAFSSFDRVEVGGFRLGSVAVNTTLVFGNVTQAPSPVDIVWVLYREAKGLGMMLGNLSLAENSIQSEASTLTTLAPLTVHVSFTTMELFESSLLIPGSATYTTLERLTMEPVTPVVLEFYGMHLQEQPLLFFSNDAQWVGVSIVYKFNVPVPVGLQGLADRLAREVRDTHIQKSSISVNEEKAELTVYNLWLRIPKWPFSEGLKDKASKESQELRGRLTHGLTTILKSTENFAEVIVEGFLFSPVIATVRLTYFKAAPSESDVQEWVTKGLRTLEDADGLYLELAVPDFDMPNSGPSGLSEASFPPYAVAMTVLGFLFLLVFPLILVLAFKTNLSSQIAGLCVWKPGCGRQVTASQYTMQSCDLKH